jgi:solute carrier family 25 (mitochondrial oxoglutarate transporter), member 11
VAVAANIIRTEGFGYLYKGLSAGLLRQATYTTARLGIYNSLSDFLITKNDGKVGPAFKNVVEGDLTVQSAWRSAAVMICLSRGAVP